MISENDPVGSGIFPITDIVNCLFPLLETLGNIVLDTSSESKGSEVDKNSTQWLEKLTQEKEDLLVETGLSRSRRARDLGKTTAKLTQTEVDALERADERARLHSTLPSQAWQPSKEAPKTDAKSTGAPVEAPNPRIARQDHDDEHEY